MSQNLLETIEGGIATLTMNRPEARNAQSAVMSDVLDTEAIHMIRTFETADHKAAAVAFVEKRAPSFQGR